MIVWECLKPFKYQGLKGKHNSPKCGHVHTASSGSDISALEKMREDSKGWFHSCCPRMVSTDSRVLEAWDTPVHTRMETKLETLRGLSTQTTLMTAISAPSKSLRCLQEAELLSHPKTGLK